MAKQEASRFLNKLILKTHISKTPLLSAFEGTKKEILSKSLLTGNKCIPKIHKRLTRVYRN